ncbi:helix-turn-helix domain-containing protein [Chamaesiphon sp.]|uniref:helix-turn-helix domain-containing protein n=1 Tax=Chamaesiphon sp. TaxID=2814140 RepID=UPI0035942E31
MTNITKGSGNVFEDCGFSPEEAADLKLRTHLMLKLRRFIRAQNWTNERAASYFGDSLSRISHLMDSDIEHFSVEQLVHLLSIAGIDAHIFIETANSELASSHPEFELGMKAFEKVATKYADALQELAE